MTDEAEVEIITEITLSCGETRRFPGHPGVIRVDTVWDCVEHGNTSVTRVVTGYGRLLDPAGDALRAIVSAHLTRMNACRGADPLGLLFRNDGRPFRVRVAVEPVPE